MYVVFGITVCLIHLLIRLDWSNSLRRWGLLTQTSPRKAHLAESHVLWAELTLVGIMIEYDEAESRIAEKAVRKYLHRTNLINMIPWELRSHIYTYFRPL